MSTIVYQGIQSCFESQIIETTTLKLKVPKDKCPSTNNLDLGGWSFLQNLSNNTSLDIKNESLDKQNSYYAHPSSNNSSSSSLSSSSSSRLSDKSLELCTESLGSETGTDIMDNNMFSFSSSPSSDKNIMQQKSTQRVESSSSSSSTTCSRNRNVITRIHKNTCREYPPPLTTISGSNTLQVTPYREGGRLIIKAVEAPLIYSYLQAERSNGRLRLSFLKTCATNYSNFEDSDDMAREENESCDEGEVENDTFESDISGDEDEEEVKEMEEEKRVDGEEEEEENDVYMKRDIDGNSFEVEVEMGNEKCQRLISRCKESGKVNKGFCDWRKPLWVASS